MAATVAGAAVDAAGDDDAHGQRRDEQGALDRGVPPHLDGQQDAEEQGGDEGGEHESEPDVGEDLLAAADAGLTVEAPFRSDRTRAAGSSADQERGGDDRRLHVEDRPPVEELREHAPEGRSDDGADSGRQHPPLPSTVLAGDHGREDGQRTGEQERRAHALRPLATSSIGSVVEAPATTDATVKIAVPARTSPSGGRRRWRSVTGTATTATTRA